MNILFLLTILAGNASCSKMNYSGYKVIKVNPKTKTEIELLEKVAENHLVNLWSKRVVSNESFLLQLKPEVIRKVEKVFKKAGIRFSVVYNDLQRAIDSEKWGTYSAVKLASTSDSSSFDFSKYHQLEEINRYLRSIGRAYKSLAKVISIGKSYGSRRILGIQIGIPKGRQKPSVVLEHGIHAREWISPATALYFINELVTKAGRDYKDILETYDLYIFPVVNPDGYVYSHTSDRMWRKSRSKTSPATCIGVDLNRNFDIHHCESSTTDCNYRCKPDFCGDYPFSESETMALRNFVLQRKGQIKLYISVHSYGQLWMTPYGYTNKSPPNYSYLVKLAKIGIAAIKAVHGTDYTFGTINRILYPVSGDSVDWVYEMGNVSLSYTIELRDVEKYGFLLPENQIIPTAEEVWAGIVAVIKNM